MPTAAPASRAGHWVATAPPPRSIATTTAGQRTATAAHGQPEGQQHTEEGCRGLLARRCRVRPGRARRPGRGGAAPRAPRPWSAARAARGHGRLSPSGHRDAVTGAARRRRRGSRREARGLARAAPWALSSRGGRRLAAGPAPSRPSARPGRYRCPEGSQAAVGQRGVGATHVAHGLAVDARRPADRVVVAGLHDDVAVGRDHQRVAGVARAGLADADRPRPCSRSRGPAAACASARPCARRRPRRRARPAPRRPARRGPGRARGSAGRSRSSARAGTPRGRPGTARAGRR